MEYSISLSASGAYIIVRVTSPVTRELALRFTKDAKAVAELGGRRIDRFLFDMSTVPNIAGISENYGFAYSDLARLDVDRSARSAVLIGPSDATHDFSELVLRNAGYNVRVFVNEDEAVSWLMQRESREGPVPAKH